MMQGIAEVYYKYASKIAMVFYLNLLWILFSCLGLVVLGIAPATAVLYKLSAKVLAGEEFPVFNTYLIEYKACFMKANLLVGLLLVVLYGLLVQYQILIMYNSLYFLIARYIILGFLLVYLMGTVFIFPLFAKHSALSIKDLLKWSFIYSVGQPIFTFATLIGLSAINWGIINFLPTLLIFVGVSLNVFIQQWFVGKRLVYVNQKLAAKVK